MRLNGRSRTRAEPKGMRFSPWAQFGCGGASGLGCREYDLLSVSADEGGRLKRAEVKCDRLA